MLLLTSQKNDVFQAIVDIRLSVIDFEWVTAQAYDDGSGDEVSRLYHKSTRLFFHFRHHYCPVNFAILSENGK